MKLTNEQVVTLRIQALQFSAGNLDNAKLILDWLMSDTPADIAAAQAQAAADAQQTVVVAS